MVWSSQSSQAKKKHTDCVEVVAIYYQQKPIVYFFKALDHLAFQYWEHKPMTKDADVGKQVVAKVWESSSILFLYTWHDVHVPWLTRQTKLHWAIKQICNLCSITTETTVNIKHGNDFEILR